MADIGDPIPLPPGWDCKYDPRTARHYFINYYTKATTWEDPRLRYQPLNNQNVNRVSGIGECIPLQEFKSSPSVNRRNSRAQQDTPLTTDTEQLVAKIGAMFPTVSETHIRLLLKKYMKGIFPEAEETIILDILAGNDNNVQKAGEQLLEMGYLKKGMKTPKLKERKSVDEKVNGDDEAISLKSKDTLTNTPRIKTIEEKAKFKAKLQEDYPNVPEPVISMALESVKYDTNRAYQILQIMVQEENAPRNNTSSGEGTPETNKKVEIKQLTIAPLIKTPSPSPTIENIIITAEKENTKSWRNKNKIGAIHGNVSRQSSVEQNGNPYKSDCILQPRGPNATMMCGPNDNLLLSDYITWNGANPDLINGTNPLNVKGPNKSLLQSKTYQPKGPNNEMRKGPIFGLAKGSIYSQLKSILCESRAK